MSTTVSIQPYSAAWQQQVIDHILHIQAHEFGIPINIEQQPDLKNIEEFYQQRNGNFWIAVSNNTIAGTIALLDIGKRRGALRKMFVHADYRGPQHGIAKNLLNTLLDWAREKGLENILLGTTEKFIAAHRFYEKNGFTAIPRESLPPEFPIMSVDVKFYSYSILQEL